MAAEEARDGLPPPAAAAPPRIMNRDPAVQIGFWQAFATQSDLSSEMTRETWYGHHFACRRILAWILLSVLSNTLAGVLGIRLEPNPPLPPILRRMGLEERLEHLDALIACQQAVCEAAHEFSDLECVVNRHGTSASVDHANYNGPERVPVPDVCYTAVADAFGVDLRIRPSSPGQDPAPNIVLFGLLSQRRRSEDKGELVLAEIRPDCSLEALFGPLVDHFSQEKQQQSGSTDGVSLPVNIPLVNAQARAGERIKANVAQSCFCDSDIEAVCQDVSAVITAFHDVVVGHPHLSRGILGVIAWLLEIIRITIEFAFPLLWITVVYRFALPWPRRQELVGFQGVSFFSTWKTLLLLCTVSGQPRSYFGDAIQIGILCFVCVYCYSDYKAARAWLDLAVVCFGAPYLYPLLDQVGAFVAKIDALYIFRFIASWIAACIVGKGWWKLVTLFVVYRAHPRREELHEWFFPFGARGRRENAMGERPHLHQD